MTGRDLKKHLPKGARARTTRDGVEVVVTEHSGRPVRFSFDGTWADPAETAAYLKSRMPGGFRVKPV